MKLAKLPNERKLVLCRKYFMAGFALLPFMWAVNFVWFFREAFRTAPYQEQRKIRQYVVLSGVGAGLWLVGLVAWTVVFQQYRSQWGATGDYMSFVVPKGIP